MKINKNPTVYKWPSFCDNSTKQIIKENRQKERYIPERIKNEVIQRQNGKCNRCGKKL